jgi:hypothetical protein
MPHSMARMTFGTTAARTAVATATLAKLTFILPS